MMAKTKRNIGLEILRGLREIRRGQHGRAIKVPEVTGIREKTVRDIVRRAKIQAE